MTEFLIKNIVAEILFGNRICESLEDKQIVDYLYKELLLERLLYGEPVTVTELRALLRQKILNFEFIKLDGEVRPAKGTTMMKYIPTSQHPKGIRPSSPKVATFYDLDKKDWRSVSQRSREIVLKKDEETGKPIIMVKDKPDGDIAVRDKEDIEVTVDDKPIDQAFDKKPEVEVKNVKPIKSTEETKTFYFINPVIGASKTVEMSPKDVIQELKKLGRDWRLAEESEIEDYEEGAIQAKEETGDYIEIGDKRNYLNKKGENIEIEIVHEDPRGGLYAKTKEGTIFKIPSTRIRNIGDKIEDTQRTDSSDDSIIKKLSKRQDLDNLEADEL